MEFDTNTLAILGIGLALATLMLQQGARSEARRIRAEAATNKRIDELAAQMTAQKADSDRRMDEMKADLTAQMTAQKADLTAQMAAQKADSDRRMDEMKADLIAQMAAQKADSDTRAEDMKSDLSARLRLLENLMRDLLQTVGGLRERTSRIEGAMNIWPGARDPANAEETPKVLAE